MKKVFAIPTINKKLSAHFGHCQEFAVISTDDNKITDIKYLEPPEHMPGTYPNFLARNGVNIIIAGGLGVKAQDVFVANNIEVFMGVNSDQPEELVEQYLKDQLESGQNLCDH